MSMTMKYTHRVGLQDSVSDCWDFETCSAVELSEKEIERERE